MSNYIFQELIHQTTLKDKMEQAHSSKNILNSDESIICKGPCRKTYAPNLFLDHLQNANRCRSKYSADEISDLQITRKLEAETKREDTTVRFVSYIKSKG